MGKLGCNFDGNLNDEKFSAPMPWIGIYVTAASLACLAAMAADVIYCFRYRRFWFPCKFFSINATSLTLLGVAIKLSVDLNTSMPSREDQLAKLSSAVLMCTVMGNSMPSLGIMENEEIITNIVALGILVVTLIVNICVQLATGAIFIFWKEHAFVMLIMLVLLVILSFSAFTVPTIKYYLEYKYNKKYELALKENIYATDKIGFNKLREDLMKHWMMAHTSCPQFVMARSVTCIASGALCLLSAMVLAESMLRSYLMPWSFKFCRGKSEYKWSTTIVLITQAIAVGVGTIAPASRWLFAINFRFPKGGNKSWKNEFKVESYWVQRYVEMKDCQLTFGILKCRDRRCRKITHDVKNQLLDICIVMQRGIVIVSKLIRLISILFVSQILFFFDSCKQMKKSLSFNNTVSIRETVPDLPSEPKVDLGRFVLHLEGEDELVELMTKCNCDCTDHRFLMGKRREPKHIIQLLEGASEGFRGVGDFDSNQVPSLCSEEPSNCWALPVVTLTCIALAFPNVNHNSIQELLCGVHEGVMYVREIEKQLHTKADLANIKKAAEVVWTGVDFYQKWMDLDLHKISLQGQSPKEVLEILAETAKNRFVEFKKKYMNLYYKENPSKWPVKMLAANSMYRISSTILINYGSKSHLTNEKLFKIITCMIADTLGACLSNLNEVITMKCMNSSIEERAASVGEAIFILGKTEKILKILENKALPKMETHRMACIDEWCLLQKQDIQWDCPTSFSSAQDTHTSGSSDVYLSVD